MCESAHEGHSVTAAEAGFAADISLWLRTTRPK